MEKPDPDALLDIRGLSVHRGAIVALRSIDLQVPSQGITGLVGANGSGKSTLIEAIMGTIPPTHGTLTFEGENLLGIKADRRLQMGIAIVPEGRRLFPNLTVAENVRIGYLSLKRRNEAVFDELHDLFPILKSRWSKPSSQLSGGEQQMVAIARALACSPRLLLLDEPSLGLAPGVVQRIYAVMRSIATSTAILAAEQLVSVLLPISRLAYVLEQGSVVLQGSGVDLLQDQRVQHAYL